MDRASGLARIVGALVLAAALAGPMAPVPAVATGSCGGAKAGVDRGEIVPLERVVGAINARWPGQLLNACLDSSNPGRPLYRVAWLSQGRKMNVVVDARTGRILSP